MSTRNHNMGTRNHNMGTRNHLSPPTPDKENSPPDNRLRLFMGHSARYSFTGVERLAVDVGIASITLKRILGGKRQASLAVAQKIARLLSHDFKQVISTDEIFSLDGTYPTASVCKLVGCSGCSLQDRSLLQNRSLLQDKLDT